MKLTRQEAFAPMKKRTKLGAAALVAAVPLALAACGGSSGGGGGGGGGASSSAAFDAGITKVVNPSTHKGGTLTFDNSSAPESTDAGNTYYAFNLNFSRLYATPLLTYKSCPGKCGVTLVPGLATALGTVSKDGLTWTYHLKSGVKFEDGTPVTAQDVKYAVERTFDRGVLPNGPSYFPNLLGGNASSYPGPYKNRSKNLMGLTAITTPDSTTVVFHLKKPFADFNYVVGSFGQTAPVPPSKDTGATYQQHPQSTGPYKFSSWSLNKQYTLVKNPQWNPSWDPQVKQLPDKIVINLGVNAVDIDNRLLAGDIQADQAGSGVQSAARARILSTPSLKANSDNPLAGFMWFYAINTQVAPTNNVHCRRAIEYAVNKTNMQTAYGGPTGGDIATTAQPPTVLGYQKFDLYNAFSKPGGDIPAAKAELKKCGQPNGFNMTVAYRSDRPREVLSSQALQNSLQAAGIKVTLKGIPTSTYSTTAGSPTYMNSHNIGMEAYGWAPDWPDAYGWGWALYDSKAIVSSGNANNAQLKDPQIDQWFNQMQLSSSLSQRNALAGKISMQVMKDAAMLPAVYTKTLLYRPPSLTNVYVWQAYGMYNYGVMGLK
jgi:peptide/nickel transport system substrate-binding protein